MSNELFNFSWDYLTQGQAVQRIVKFEKRMKEKSFEVVISGKTDKEYRENLDKFLQLTDIDINNLKMGRLYVGKYYLECYIFASGKPKRYVGTLKTLIQCSIICENGNWQSDEKKTFREGTSSGETPTGNGILYPYDYQYDYSAPFSKNSFTNESYMDTDFELILYGPWPLEEIGTTRKGPEVIIGGNAYRVYHELEADQKLVINSRKKTAVIVKYDGTEENVFMNRDKSWNLFEKIKTGNNLVVLPSSHAMDITLFYERSEPFWGDQIWT
jgi:hypothetical protein